MSQVTVVSVLPNSDQREPGDLRMYPARCDVLGLPTEQAQASVFTSSDASSQQRQTIIREFEEKGRDRVAAARDGERAS